jgi:anti-sigma28 factor (negative regulator of flagellin synthesis)
MQISGISTSQVIPMGKTNQSHAESQKPALDQAVVSFSSNSFSSLVKEAAQMPEVRSEVVDAYKARIQSGEYPSQETISGLTDLIGPAIVEQADSAT